MKPILFDKNATDFTTNGIGRLNPTECIVEEIRNGAYEAELTLPRDDKYCSLIENGSIIAMMVSDGSIQRFRVYEIEKTLDDEFEIKCQHISYDLSYIPVGPYTASTALSAIQGIKTHTLPSSASNPFNFNSDVESGATFNPIIPASARSYLGGMEGSILDVYGGEYKFDNMNVYLYQNRGTDSGVTIRWGKNITELEDEVTTEDTVEGILPFWTDGSYVVLGDVLTVSGTAGKKVVVENVSSEIEVSEENPTPTKAQVNAAGQTELAKKVTAAEETITVEYYQNPDIARVQLCDYVTVIYEPYNISVKLKVVGTKWDVLAEKYKDIELGKYKSFSQTITAMSTAIDNIYYTNGVTTIRLERTEEGLISEVSRAETEERDLRTTIYQTADAIVSEAAANVVEYDETKYTAYYTGYGAPTYPANVNTGKIYYDTQYKVYYISDGENWNVISGVDYYGYGVPWDSEEEKGYDPSENAGKIYLDRASGYYYTCDGIVWGVGGIFPTMNAQLGSRITQTATEIKQEVSGTFNQYELPWNLFGDTFTYYDYGEPDKLDYKPSASYYNDTYFDLTNGDSYICLYDSYNDIYYWSQQTRYYRISVDLYGMGQPSQETASSYPNGHYIDEDNGYVYISENIGGSYTWHWDTNVYPWPAKKITEEVRGELSLKLDKDDDGRIVSLLTGSANYIQFTADNMFTVDAPNFSVNHYGIIEANGASLRNTTAYYADIYNPNTGEYDKTLIGDFGLTNVGGQYGDTGIGIRNAADTAAVVMGPTTGNLWLKGANEVIYLGAYGLLPWSGNIDLGNSSYRWGKLWVTDIDTVNAVVVSSDKRMKDVKGTIDKVREFYMALKPLQYTFKEGVHKDTSKVHYGLVAQEVLESYEKCYNSDEQEIVVKVEADDSTKEVIGDDMKYALDYNELHAFHIAMIQELRAEVDALKSEIKALKEGDKR